MDFKDDRLSFMTLSCDFGAPVMLRMSAAACSPRSMDLQARITRAPENIRQELGLYWSS